MPKVTCVCEGCGTGVERYPSQAVRFCSARCRARGIYAAGRMLVPAKVCDCCGATFAPVSSRQRWCKTCAPDKAARARLQRYGVSQPIWELLLDKYGGRCWLCPIPASVLEHCHRTGRVRGAVCAGCNAAIARVELAGWLAEVEQYLTGGDPYAGEAQVRV